MEKEMILVTRDNITAGQKVIDSEGMKGIVRDCKDLHNVHVTLEGEGLTIDWYGKSFECGGSGMYCFVEGCDENSEMIAPLYLDIDNECKCKEQKQVSYHECCGDHCRNIKNIEH